MRDEWDSTFYVNNAGDILVRSPGMKKSKAVGHAHVPGAPPDLLKGEYWLLERWRETDQWLKDTGLRPNVFLIADRNEGFEYGFLWMSFGFYRIDIRKRWGPGVSKKDLESAVEAFIKTLEKAQPQGGRTIEKQERRWTFDVEIADEKEAKQVIEILLDHLDRSPVLALAFKPA